MALYRRASSFFKERFGARVYRVAVDAGFTCPNRDGTLANGGCVFCDEAGSRAAYVNPEISIEEQVLSGMEKLKKSYGAEKFVVYFQAYSNTYAPLKVLKEVYSKALKVSPDIVGLSVSTRPDLLQDSVLDLLKSINKDYFVMVEIGVQSFDYAALIKSRRFHRPSDSIDAIIRTKKKGLNVIAHMIFGLFGEIEPQIIDGGRMLSLLGVDGVKIHNLYVVRGTELEKLYKRGRIKVYQDPQHFARLVVRFLENISPEMVIHRLQGFASRKRLVAPSWTSDKHLIPSLVEKIMTAENTHQGKYYKFGV